MVGVTAAFLLLTLKIGFSYSGSTAFIEALMALLNTINVVLHDGLIALIRG